MAVAKKKTAAARPVADGDKKKALETALAQIEKDFGKGTIMKLGENTHMQVDSIPTGSSTLTATSRCARYRRYSARQNHRDIRARILR